MARIRSVHPTLWTDGKFVRLSLAARLFLIGLWTQADDWGVFLWEPIDLKMRLAPADNSDTVVLLEEIRNAGFVWRFTHSGRDYGAIKRFREYQRPQKPSAPLVRITIEIAAFIGVKFEAIPEAYRTTTGIVPEPSATPTVALPESGEQMEDGGDKRKVEEDLSIPDLPLDAAREQATQPVNGHAVMPFDPPPDDAVDQGFRQFWAAYPLQVNQVQAEAAFITAARAAPVAEIIAGAKRYAASEKAKPPSKTGQVYTAQPANWLRDKRWTDNLPEPGAAARSPEDEAFWANHARVMADYGTPKPEPVRRKFAPGRIAPALFSEDEAS